MGAGEFHDDPDRLVHDAELEMAKLVDGRIEMAFRTSGFALFVITYAVMTIVGLWLRTLLVPHAWEVAAAGALAAAVAWAMPVLIWAAGRKPPGWAAAAETCQKALDGRVPDPVMAEVSRFLGEFRRRRRCRGEYVYLSRCTSRRPPDGGVCRTAGVVPMAGRLVVVLGEHLTGEPLITRAALAHEGAHMRPGRAWLAALDAVGRSLGWVILGWAVSSSVLLPAVAAYWAALVLLSWVVEFSCDYTGAVTGGADAMLATLDYLGAMAAADAVHRSRRARSVRSAAVWAAGPMHPPLPLRRALIGFRWPHARTAVQAVLGGTAADGVERV